MRTLIAWFSWSGNTQAIAEHIARKTRGELFRIEREVPYSTDYSTCAYREAKEEADKQLKPAIQEPLPEIADYDAVIIAFPIWWYTMPAPVKTFLESCPDWQGKPLYVFANSYTDDRRQFANALVEAAECAKGADVRPGLYNKDIERLCTWAKENGFTRRQKYEEADNNDLGSAGTDGGRACGRHSADGHDKAGSSGIFRAV
jgi:multimeric flavodoxin WrbA